MQISWSVGRRSRCEPQVSAVCKDRAAAGCCIAAGGGARDGATRDVWYKGGWHLELQLLERSAESDMHWTGCR
jgi:hypothetical protein